jgi:hypothetical protein
MLLIIYSANWSLEGDQHSLMKVADSCNGITLVMTAHPVIRQPEDGCSTLI